MSVGLCMVLLGCDGESTEGASEYVPKAITGEPASRDPLGRDHIRVKISLAKE